MREVHLTRSEAKRLERTVEAIVSGSCHPASFGGKVLTRMNGVISVPLGRRKRILFERFDKKYKLLQVVTHERYNQLLERS